MPLKYQILLPMAFVTLATVGALTLLSATMAGRRATILVERRVAEVAETLEASPFPLTEAVLLQIKGLTGAELVRATDDGRVLTATLADLTQISTGSSSPQLQQVSLADTQFLGSRIQLGTERRAEDAEAEFLHVLFPKSAILERRSEEFWPPMLVGGLALAAVSMLALVIHRRLSKPLEQLQTQVERVAEGDFTPMPLPTRRDEVHRLADSVNRMARMLAESERQVRRSERARTLGQLGGGMAHHLRNSVTGAQIALALHRKDCQADPDALDMVQRQLTLMESYLQKFLSIGSPQASSGSMVDLREVLLSLEPLLRPRASHVHVALELDAGTAAAVTWGDAGELEQLLLNLIMNAIEAAAESEASHRVVRVRLDCGSSIARLTIEDTGDGPSPQLADQLFEPFVSDKAEGVGLGLAVAQQAASSHGGNIHWERSNGWTKFLVELPLREASRGEPSDR